MIGRLLLYRETDRHSAHIPKEKAIMRSAGSCISLERYDLACQAKLSGAGFSSTPIAMTSNAAIETVVTATVLINA